MNKKHKMTELRWQAINNPYYRSILETGQMLQVALMSLRPGEETGTNAHAEREEVLVNVAGCGKIILNGEVSEFLEHDWVMIRPGVAHNVINTGESSLKMIVMYTPPHFSPDTIHKQKPRHRSRSTIAGSL